MVERRFTRTKARAHGLARGGLLVASVSDEGSPGDPPSPTLATSKLPRASPCARPAVLVTLLSTNHASLDVGKPPGGMVVGVGMCDGCVLNRSSEAAHLQVGRHIIDLESACGAITAASCWWSPPDVPSSARVRPNHQHESEVTHLRSYAASYAYACRQLGFGPPHSVIGNAGSGSSSRRYRRVRVRETHADPEGAPK